MEVLAVASGKPSIVTLTLGEAQSVLSLIKEIADAPQSLVQELQDLESVLTQLSQAEGNGGVDIGLAPVAAALNTCHSELERLKVILTTGKDLKDDEIKESINALQAQKLSLQEIINQSKGDAVLVRAASTGSIEDIKQLLEEGADIESRDLDTGHTALHAAASQGRNEIVSFLLDKGADIESRVPDTGETALHLAVLAEHQPTINVLLAEGADIECRTGTGPTPLHLAARKGFVEIVKLLLQRGADIEKQIIETGNNVLHTAAFFGYNEMAEILLQKGLDIESTMAGFDDRTVLHMAALGGNDHTVRFLLEKGANIECKDSNGYTPLHIAVEATDEDTVSVLLEKGADTENRLNSTLAPLHVAAGRGYDNIVSMLLEKGAVIDQLSNNDYTPLHLAVVKGQIGAVSLLLEKGADIEKLTDYNFSSLDVATISGNDEMASLLLEHGADIGSRSGYTPLHRAAERGFNNIVIMLLGKGADIESRLSETSYTPLHLTAHSGFDETARLLLEKGADIESTVSNNGYTALHIAADQGSDKVVSVLLEKGADIGKVNNYGKNALHIAALDGQYAVVSLLLEKGADPGVRCLPAPGYTPLHLAAFKGHEKVVDLLLEKGADIGSMLSGTGNTALHLAAEQGHDEVVGVLLQRGADIEKPNNTVGTALHAAVKAGQDKIVSLLLEKGADIESKLLGTDKTVTEAAIAGNHASVVRCLLARFSPTGELKDAVLNYSNDTYGGLLRLAAISGSCDILELLSSLGIDLQMRLSRGSTALHIAASHGQLDAVDFLLKHAADHSLLDGSGWSPIVCAWRNNHPEIIERLSKHGSVLPKIDQLATLAPSCWSQADKSTHIELSKDDQYITVLDIAGGTQILCIRAEHSIPAEKSYYFEIEIINPGQTGAIGLGLSGGFTDLEIMPGWASNSIGYHGDDGNRYIGSGHGQKYAETFSTGDVVGCGVNFDRSAVIFTRNGEALDTITHSLCGQLYPMIGVQGPGAQIYANFGQRPFVFQDFDKIVGTLGE